MARRLHHVSYILYLLSIISIHGAVLRRTWTTQPWCESVRKPQWPFAYQKTATQTLEWQGRVNPNDQDIRHQCSVFGVQSKCHMCENFACNGDSGDRCAFQFQGVPWSALPKNIPTVTDVPWAVGGQHRYDYGGGTHLCAFLSASGELTHRGAHPNRNSSDAEASDIWSYSPLFGESGRSQGQVTTVAGEGTAGFLDGPVATAQFNHPRGVAVDSNGVVYVADTANHRIRIIDPTTKMVSTLAGDGIEGFSDGAALSVARFSYPSDVAVLETNSGTSVTVFVADTGNHRIRQIKNGIVTCLSGLCGAGVETVRLSQQPEKPHAGLADGDPLGARFDSPMGVAADADGVIFVADTGNHLIRRIEPDGTTHTVAGGVVPSEDADTPGCLSPCQRGERGFRDGNLTFARFESPRAIAVGAQRTLIVGEGHRVRRVTYDGGPASTIESVTSTNRVVTLAGSNVPGHIDGEGNEATFNAPAGVAFAADGRMYAASSTDCSVRQISPAALVSRAVTCSTRATEMLRPSGCASYEQPVDELFLQTSPTANNIYHNYLQRKEFDPVQGTAIAGRTLKDCTGSPSADGLVQGDLALPLRDPDTQAIITDVFEDLEYGTTIKISCPAACDASSTSKVYGSGLYSDASSICLAAIHSGAIVAAQGGLVTLTLERGAQPAQTAKTMGSTANGVTSLDVPTTQNDRARLFSVKSYLRPKLEVQSIAGAPNAPLGSQQDGCGYLDAQPPLAARFLGIAGLDIARSRSLSRTEYLYIADAGNNHIRWTGDDCYYSPNQATYLAAEPSTATHPRQAVTNPTYTATIEQIAYTQVTVASETRGGVRYKPAQGGYACSIRSITKWEKPLTPDGSPAYYFNHPNYYSRYMDRELSADGHYHTQWTGMMWPPLYTLSKPPLDDTREGWKRGGTWSYVSGKLGERVVDTDASYRPQVTYTAQDADRRGFWNSSVFGDCVDQVVRGCFNNGTCVAPGERVAQSLCVHKSVGITGRVSLLTSVSASLGAQIGETGVKMAKRFVLNVASRSSSNFRALRGNYDSATAARNCDTYRCPQYDVELVANDGRSFQTGCSVGDPEPNPKRSAAFTSAQQIQNLLDYRDDLNVARVSDEFLCGNIVWHQGDIESNNGTNRVTRTNYVNVTKVDDVTWEYGISTPGEGVYECFNSGACVAPDECACGDGWTGIDCNTPLCRFQKADKYAGVASGCRNGGVCVSKDQCRCITVKSSLHEHFSTAPTGITGYFGSDCALPICIQGLFDPICNASVVANDLNLTSGNITGIDVMASSIVSSGDGCYRCKNGGLCIAPDVCSCAEGWTGFDCSTPICELPKAVVASVRSTLFTVDELKVETFRTDPCGTKGGRWGKEIVNGAMVGQGNCSLPMKCTCLCRKRYDKKLCASTGELCEKPWQDPFHRSIPPGFVYGTRDCVDGFQGIEDANGNFQTCHLQIYVPSAWRRYTVSFVAILSVLGMIILVAWYYIRKRVRRALLLAKAERRRSRKNSEENLNKPKLGAFTHAKND
ncbi:hypothetical protein PC117_g2261 [Phytophthora cactorum]|uniref:EGF-like domain-containing protein n=1 Tax=Phytophthora cactorum TaxID=29920 RepID=A0A8T1EKM5_9STRA|nr:hypothetical protein PC117_g2261 [Phytophthora cactorum]